MTHIAATFEAACAAAAQITAARSQAGTSAKDAISTSARHTAIVMALITAQNANRFLPFCFSPTNSAMLFSAPLT